MVFEWGPEKARANVRKHRMAFELASTVFLDPLALTFPDPNDVHDEPREITIGHAASGTIVFVAHCRRGDRTRIISARRATRRERQQYEEGIGDDRG